MADTNGKPVSYESLFQKYRDMRVVTKARDYCRYTLATLVSEPEASSAGDTTQQQVTRDYQSIGALLVNNLVARLGEYLFPANARFVKLKVVELTDNQRSNITALNDALITIEKAIVERVRQNGGYADILMALAYLATTGNVAMFRGTDDEYLVYGLENYSVRRDGRGRVCDAVIKERIEYDALDPKFQKMLEKNGTTSKSRCWLYTRIHRVQRGDNWGYSVTQQIGNQIDVVFTPGEEYYPEKVCPWIFPVWSLKSGEHYGRGQVETCAGDFAKLSELSEASHLYSQEALRVLHLLIGMGGNQDDIEGAVIGQVVPLMSSTTLTAYEVGDADKMAQAQSEISQVVQRLSQAFMYTGEFRDSERTTAEEIQQVATSAERGLGGPYSMLAKTLQIPLAYVVLSHLSPEDVPDIVGNKLQLSVVAGLDALGRNIEAEALLQALGAAQAATAAIANINQSGGTIDPDPVVQTIFASYGVELEKYRKSAQQLQAEAQQIDSTVAAANGAGVSGGGVNAPIQPAASVNQI